MKILDLKDSVKKSIMPFSGSFNFPKVIKYFFSRIYRDFGMSTAIVYMYNKDDEELDLVGYKGLSEEVLISLKNFKVSHTNRDILSRTVLNQSIETEDRWTLSSNISILDPFFIISIPIIFQRETLGVLLILKTRATEKFSFDSELFKMHYFLLCLGIKIFHYLEIREQDSLNPDSMSKYDMDLEKILIYQRIIKSMVKEFSFLEFIVNPLEALRKKIKGEELMQILDGIHYILRDTFERVRKIEDFTNIKIEETISEVSLEIFDPTELIDFDKIKEKTKSKRIEISSNLEKGYKIKAKKDEIKRALSEIFDNVFQFILRDSSLMISTYYDKDYFSISIMSSVDPDVFDIENDSLEPFIATSPWSMGLGFSIAFSLIARNNGKLLFFTQGNHLFTTRILFPVYIDYTQKEDGKKNILVIDDDRTFIDMMYEILIDRGYKVDTASNASEGVEKIISQEFDAVICDIKLPDHEGWWILEYLQDYEKGNFLKKPPFILTSGYLDELDKSRMLKHGVRFSINKPFRYIDLINVLSRVL